MTLLPYDLGDPLILEMVERSHRPTENWLVPRTSEGTVFGTPTLKSIECLTCGHSWPCPSRVQLDEFLTQESKFLANEEALHGIDDTSKDLSD